MVLRYGKILGFFEGPYPTLWVTDPEIIKSIMVKDFEHFTDRRVNELLEKVIQ